MTAGTATALDARKMDGALLAVGIMADLLKNKARIFGASHSHQGSGGALDCAMYPHLSFSLPPFLLLSPLALTDYIPSHSSPLIRRSVPLQAAAGSDAAQLRGALLQVAVGPSEGQGGVADGRLLGHGVPRGQGAGRDVLATPAACKRGRSLVL